MMDALRSDDAQNQRSKKAHEADRTTLGVVVGGFAAATLAVTMIAVAVSPTGREHTTPRIRVPAVMTQDVGSNSVKKLITSDNPLLVYRGATILDKSGQLNPAAVAFERSGSLYFNSGKYKLATTAFGTAAAIFHQSGRTNEYAVAQREQNQSIVLSLS